MLKRLISVLVEGCFILNFPEHKNHKNKKEIKINQLVFFFLHFQRGPPDGDLSFALAGHVTFFRETGRGGVGENDAPAVEKYQTGVRDHQRLRVGRFKGKE